MQINPRLTITLTNRRPVVIKKAEWPIIASAKHSDRLADAPTTKLFVRQHKDGRAIVYGITDGSDGRRGGEVLFDGDMDEIASAVTRVGKSLDFGLELMNECLAELPAEAI